MVSIKFQQTERDILVSTIDEWLDGEQDILEAYYADKSIDDPSEFLAVVNDHSVRVQTLRELKERLTQ